jgi:hypothetical chaperone protein
MRARSADNGLSKIGVGIDFGTSNSSVATFDGQELRCLKILDGGGGNDFVPTATYISRSLLPLTGSDAINQYLEDNQDRQINLTKEHVGDIDITTGFGDIDDARTITVHAHAWTDQELPGRLFREIKSWLGREDIERIWVFERPFTLAALITPIFEKLRNTYTHCETDPAPTGVHVGRPVRFVGKGTEVDSRALARLTSATRFAGIEDPDFFLEPEAAALSYLHAHPVDAGAIYLVFDFGGGTLDLSVIRAKQVGFHVLASEGIGLGGNTIDRLILERKVFPEIGQGASTWRNEASRDETVEFRFTEFAELLLDWQNAYQLNTPRSRHQIRLGIEYGGESATKLRRLRSIVINNLSYRILRAVEEAKIRLSSQFETEIVVPEIDLEIPINRLDIEAVLAGPLKQIDRIVGISLAQAGVRKHDLMGVVCTGGSSHIPQVRAHLERLLGTSIFVHDAFTGIAAGLAIANFQGWRSSPGSST